MLHKETRRPDVLLWSIGWSTIRTLAKDLAIAAVHNGSKTAWKLRFLFPRSQDSHWKTISLCLSDQFDLDHSFTVGELLSYDLPANR